MPALKSEKRELFAQGISRGVGKRQAALNAGFSAKGAAVEGTRLSKDPEVLLRVSEIIAKVAEVKAKVATDAFEAALAEIPASLGSKTVAAVATAVRERHYRITCIQDIVDRHRMLIDERAAAARADESAAPGANTGLLVRKQKNLREGKKTRIVEEWVYDSAVIGDLAMMLKHGAIEAGEWQEEGRQLPPVGPDLSHMTTDQLFAEQRILRETEQRIEAIRAGKPDPLMIQAAGPVVEVAGFQSGDVVEGVVVDADRGFVTNSDRIVDSDGGTHGDAEPESDLAPR